MLSRQMVAHPVHPRENASPAKVNYPSLTRLRWAGILAGLMEEAMCASSRLTLHQDRIARCDRSDEAVLRSLIVLHLCSRWGRQG
jgi:hypothetical protein